MTSASTSSFASRSRCSGANGTSASLSDIRGLWQGCTIAWCRSAPSGFRQHYLRVKVTRPCLVFFISYVGECA